MAGKCTGCPANPFYGVRDLFQKLISSDGQLIRCIQVKNFFKTHIINQNVPEVSYTYKCPSATQQNTTFPT